MILLLFLLWGFGLRAGGCFSKTKSRVQPKQPNVPLLVLPKQQIDSNASTPGSRPITLTITSQVVVSHKLVKYHGRGPSVGGIDPIRNTGQVRSIVD